MRLQRILGAIVGAVLLLLLTSASPVQAPPPTPHLNCTWQVDRAFCLHVYEAHQRLKDNYWTRWWSDWAEEHEVLVEEYERTGAWPSRNTVAFSNPTGSVRDSIVLLHEYQHIIDDHGLPPGVTCSTDPWAHERVNFWTMLGAVALGDQEWAWSFYTKQSGDYYQARALPYGLTEPCREFGAVEIAPWGTFTYSELRGLLDWW